MCAGGVGRGGMVKEGGGGRKREGERAGENVRVYTQFLVNMLHLCICTVFYIFYLPYSSGTAWCYVLMKIVLNYADKRNKLVFFIIHLNKQM